MNILIITNLQDIETINAIKKHLSQNVNIERLNIDDFENNVLTIKNDDLLINGNSFKNFNSILVRRFSFVDGISFFRKIKNSTKLDNYEYNYFALLEYKATINGLFKSIQARTKVFNNFKSFDYAKNKIINLKFAEKIGLNIPKSIFSNNIIELEKFGNVLDWDIVLKTHYSFDISVGDKQKIMPVKKISSDIFEKFKKSINFVPVFFQEYIHKKHEIRVVVIGTDIFPFAIYSQEIEEAKIDWRIPNLLDLKYQLVKLPSNISDMLILFNKKNNLDFSFFDLIVTPDDKVFFLECNIDGEWLWLEKATGVPLSKFFANMIEKYKSNCLNEYL